MRCRVRPKRDLLVNEDARGTLPYRLLSLDRVVYQLSSLLSAASSYDSDGFGVAVSTGADGSTLEIGAMSEKS